jgi:putative spermidine/putrescine transport system permease protein
MSARRLLALALMLAPGLACLAVFFVVPLLQLVAISFFRYSPTEIWVEDFTLENYLRFGGHYYTRALGTTLVVAFTVTAICIVLAYPFAYFLVRIPERKLGPYLFVLVSPLMMSSVVLILGWVVILGPHGPIVVLLQTLGLGTVTLLYSKGAIALGLTELLLPFMVLPLMSALENIHPSLEEAAQNLGAGSIERFRRVIWPLSRPGLVSGSLLVFSLSLGSLVVPALLGAPRDAMLGNVVYEEVMNSLNWPFASAVGVILLAGTSALMSAYLRTRRSARYPGAMRPE